MVIICWTECFAKQNSFLIENKLNLDDRVKNYVMEHLYQLKKTIREYFTEEETKYDWIKNYSSTTINKKAFPAY